MKSKRLYTSARLWLAPLAASLCLGTAITPALAAPVAVPQNLGGGLRPLVDLYFNKPAALQPALDASKVIQRDGANRIAVNIHLDGTVGMPQLKEKLQGLGLTTITEAPTWRKGLITAWMPMAQANTIARLPGVRSVILAPKPRTNVGLTTSQGAVVLKTDQVNALGFTGAGITVGLLSDSYNVSTRPTTTAIQDVQNGDLPRLRNSNRLSPGVKFLIEGTRGSSDEGRGMAQIVYDIAPGADLCFATSGISEATFASNIRSLRTNSACLADVIVDDIIFLAEPMFSDGVVAQAVDDVVTSSSLAGKKVAYFSSAGNRGKGYTSDFRLISNSVARTQIDPIDPTINLATIPASIDTTGGFQDFDPGSATDISQTVTCSGGACTVVFQWDDPFDVGGITTDFNFLVFDASGNYVSTLSLTDNNFATDEPLEFSSTDLVADTTYRIVIARTGTGSQLASRLKYVFFGGSLLGEYNTETGSFAATYGHNSAANGNGVAAYVYDDVPPIAGFTPSIEGFSSPGPVTIVFDTAGNRLSTAQIRNKPDLAATDGVNTTFFPPGPLSSTDYEGDGFPNFFGTSAAAPHAAGIAALLLQKAGGPLSLTPLAIRTTLQNTAPPRDIDPVFSQAVVANLSVSVSGDIPTDPNAFKIQLSGSGQTLTALTIDATPAGLVFDPSATAGFPLTVGSTTGPTLTSPAPTTPVQVLNLTFSGFTSGNTLTFGIDRDIASINGFGNSADLLAQSIVTATFSDNSTVTATFANLIGLGYTVYDGFGLVDALAATNAVP